MNLAKMHIGLSGKIMIIFYKILAVNTCYSLFSNISILKNHNKFQEGKILFSFKLQSFQKKNN